MKTLDKILKDFFPFVYAKHIPEFTYEDYEDRIRKVKVQLIELFKKSVSKEVLCDKLKFYGKQHDILDCKWCLRNQAISETHKNIDKL